MSPKSESCDTKGALVVQELTRESSRRGEMVLQVDNLTYDVSAQRIVRGEHAIFLTRRERAYLHYLMSNAGLVVTRRMLEEALWDEDTGPASNVIDVYIRRLRSKIEFRDMPQLLITIRGTGYRLG